mmetsp:Transcript_23904/g.70165  ORF Transcript_23904/g.70165 Transcript_23904/m.70165 type:complete len:97 (+) Transcript_23904:554-844(+)
MRGRPRCDASVYQLPAVGLHPKAYTRSTSPTYAARLLCAPQQDSDERVVLVAFGGALAVASLPPWCTPTPGVDHWQHDGDGYREVKRQRRDTAGCS